MTLCISWVRKLNEGAELVVATDSRLRFGCAWDGCPKIVEFNRGDAVMCFAGDTQYAYPLLQQVAKSVNQYPKSNSRALDITDLRGHILRIMTRMRKFIHDLPIGQKKPEDPETKFILAGYSWRYEDFYIWEIYFDKKENCFSYHTQATIWRSKCGIIGDSVKEARLRIHKKLEAKGKEKGSPIDMEPFEVLRDIIREEVDPSIGGPIQIVKVYKHLNTMPYGIYWPDKKSKQITFLGRPLLEYEITPHLILDPDSLETHAMKIDNLEMERKWDDGKI